MRIISKVLNKRFLLTGLVFSLILYLCVKTYGVVAFEDKSERIFSKIAVINNLGKQASSDFWKTILMYDDGHTFDENSREHDLAKSDFSVIVVSEWNELLSLDYGGMGEDLFSETRKLGVHNNFFTALILVNGENVMYTIIYKIG